MKIGDKVKDYREGTIVGFYSSVNCPEGYVVEHNGVYSWVATYSVESLEKVPSKGFKEARTSLVGKTWTREEARELVSLIERGTKY